MEKISIIVPIYNVEKYLKDCIESLINQTYTNIEIILINDGSTDSSLDICNQYSRQDTRIRVFSKPNGGLSDARNFGIDKATGKYITFVDSDDYVDINTYKIAIDNLEKENAQIFIFGRCYLYGNKKEIYHNKNVRLLMNNVEALDKMNMFGFYDVAAWDKVYERKLFDNIRYPIKKLSEDWYTTYKILDKADKILYDSTPLYVYRQRANSITHSDNIKVNMDPIYASREVLKFIKEKHNEIMLNALTRYIFASIGVYNNLLVYKKDSYIERKKILDEIKKNYSEVVGNKSLTKSRKLQIILIVKCNFIYNYMIKIFKKNKERKSKK